MSSEAAIGVEKSYRSASGKLHLQITVHIVSMDIRRSCLLVSKVSATFVERFHIEVYVKSSYYIHGSRVNNVNIKPFKVIMKCTIFLFPLR